MQKLSLQLLLLETEGGMSKRMGAAAAAAFGSRQPFLPPPLLLPLLNLTSTHPPMQLLSALLRPFEDEEVERQEREQTKEKLRVAAEAELVQRRLAGLGQGPEGGASGSGGEGAAAAGSGAGGAAAMQTDQGAAAAGGEAAADAAAAAAAACGGSGDIREASPGGSGTQQAVAPAAPSPAPAAAMAGAAGAGAGGSGAGVAAGAAHAAGDKPADESKQREEDRKHAQYKAAFEALPLPLLRTLPQVGTRGVGRVHFPSSIVRLVDWPFCMRFMLANSLRPQLRAPQLSAVLVPSVSAHFSVAFPPSSCAAASRGLAGRPPRLPA